MTVAALTRFLRNCSGNAAIEMALSVPLIMALLFTTMEGANFLYSQHKVIKGVRDGARYAARLPFSKYTCPSTIDAASVTAIKNLTRTGYVDGNNPNITGSTDDPVLGTWTNSDITVTLNCDATTSTGIYAGVTGGAPRVKVSAVVRYPAFFAILGFDFAQIARLNAASQAAVMGS